MSIDRTTIIKGPAKITFDSATIFSEADIEVAFITDWFEVPTSAFGSLDRRVGSRRIEVSFIPKMWDNLAKLFPYATSQIGTAIFGATDKPLVITPANGAPLTLANAAVTQLPGVTLSHGRPILRGMRFTCLCANNSNAATAANWFSWGSVATGVALTGFDLTKVPNTRYELVRNSVTYRAEEGYSIDFSLGLAPDIVDGEGVVNYRITELGATLRFLPTGKTEAEYATLLGWDGIGPGAAGAKHDAVITGAGSGAPIVTIIKTQVLQGGAAYGPERNRTGEVELACVRTQTTGALDALWTFAEA